MILNASASSFCGITTPLFWDWDWASNGCVRSLVFDALLPTAVLFMCWRTMPAKSHGRSFAPFVGSFDLPSPLSRLRDNRVWVGPMFLLLVVAQTAIQAMRLRKDRANSAAVLFSSALAFLEWFMVALLAMGQWLAFLWSDRISHRGLFNRMVSGFIFIQLACAVLKAYYAFFVPSQWKTPMWGPQASESAILLEINILVNVLATVLLLVAHPLPQFDAAGSVPQPSVDTELLVDHEQPGGHRYKLSGESKPKRHSPEVHSSILSNAFFSWMNKFMELGRQRQIQLTDTFSLNGLYKPANTMDRFNKYAKPGRGLLLQIFYAFKYQFLAQVILCPSITLVDYAQPFMMQRILQFIDQYSKDSAIGLRYGYFLATTLLMTNIVGTFVEQQQQWHSRSLSMYIRNILVSLLTNKTLRRRTKESSSGKDEKKKKDGAFGEKESSDGRVYNILTADISRISKLPALFGTCLYTPSQQIIGCYYMYKLLGLAGLIGTLAMVILMWFGQHLVVKAKNIEAELGLLNDKRLAVVSEVVRGIASVKLFGWGSRFIEVVGERRAKQLTVLWQRSKVWAAINMWTIGTMPFVNFIMFAIYSFGKELDAETTFTAIAVFKVLQRSITWLPSMVAEVINVYVSFRRVEAFLGESEVQSLEERVDSEGSVGAIGFRDAELVWRLPGDSDTSEAGRNDGAASTDPLEAATPISSNEPFALRSISVSFPTGQLTLVGGPTGSGKSSLVSALIGEMTLVGGQIIIPTTVAQKNAMALDNIAYVSQEAWLRNATIRENILFGEPYIQSRYEQVLRICALKPDLRIFVAGDQTEVGERGITLSGGQRQRVALARAVYSRRQVILIDDCLSAVDAHTGKYILHECLLAKGGLMEGRTRVLITHHMAMCLPYCQYVVMMKGGQVELQGSPQEVRDAVCDYLADEDASGEKQDGENSAQVGHILDDHTTEDEYSLLRERGSAGAAAGAAATGDSQGPSAAGRLIEDEVRLRGLIKLDTWKRYFSACGGWQFILPCFTSIILAQLLAIYKDYYLSTKVGPRSNSSLDQPPTTDVSHSFEYLAVYLLISLVSAVIGTLTMLGMYWGSLRASTILHEGLLHAVVYATPRFSDTTPVGRTLARFSKDMQITDEDIMEILYYFTCSLVSAITTLVVISSAVPLFIVVGSLMLLVYARITWHFMQSQRETKRLESTSFAPLISLYSEMISGVESIRAFGMHQAYVDEMVKRFSEYVTSDYLFRGTRRWLGSRMGIVSSLVSFSTTVFILINIEAFSSSLAGFILIYAVNFWMDSVSVIRRYSNLELSLNAVERVGQYLEIEQEAASKSSAANKPPQGWPRTGQVDVKGLVAGYLKGTPVLHGLDFSVRHGEKIGVVGRTGAGKSTLSLALLRFVEAASGTITIDGVNVSRIGLEDLRQKVTIIPQAPVLFNGTIRFNLDPFGDYPDEILMDALRRTLLLKSPSSSVSSTRPSSAQDNGSGLQEDGLLGSSVAAFTSLDDQIMSNGQNLSLGQRQLVALARALVRRSKLVIMDEATASVDFATDECMQRTIRGSEFSDSTILCIAHRLRTIIDYDRVLVLDQGKVVEFDTPGRLIRHEGSYFRWLCERSGEFEALQSMAKAG
ncbi:hypothetical protein GQ54DRAFT_298726 [Martensiomyces pterosporus]|nr:hypothetical protein GQ54DRAFT_298726 [Martensiomyces pterosporus]